ncbi:hypothetical protein [Sphingomonas sp. BAUL-RG-20F-R05-02]|uniref:hypothetical protein n=1 Tax=Sphingomonas sp. BAUL-RG-20F-R05-02 TaxID=2914830 RepID=UPI001F588768|nr:hypothetical protein [Sphingomonas sp. BAUL-RG-20F-R05-02]
MQNRDFRTLERQLLTEIATKDREIALLKAEREVLERVLYNARKREIGDLEVTRSNSIGRVMAEAAILKRLEGALRAGVDVRQLELTARTAVPSLAQSTFRSHLHRLKERGLIEAPKRGSWRLVEDKPIFSVGDLVRHGKLGVGTITGLHEPSTLSDRNSPSGKREVGWTYLVDWDGPEQQSGRYIGKFLELVHSAGESR